MSTFDGVIKEYPLISIDCFLKKKGNFKSTAYFLSHCHKDHMKGLSNFYGPRKDNFYDLLRKRGFSKIYLSDVSSQLLKNDYEYQHLSEYLEVLPLERPTLIPLYNQEGEIQSRVVVTLLTAGHCLGSVMFFIEGYNGNVLYTGDFRLPVGSSARLTYLHENDCLKPLKSLYIDTTFCNATCLYIPSREECLNAVLSIVEPWLDKGPNHIVCFLCPYEYAYEFIFVELFKKFGVKTHVKSKKKRMYASIKQIEDAVTTIASEARIHACALFKDDPFEEDTYLHETPCGFISPNGKPVEIKKILPTAMFFRTQYFSEIAFWDENKNMERVCYSTHASLSEIRDMVSYLKPEKVFPNVVAGQTVEQILDLIYLCQETENDELSPLGKLKSPCGKDFSSVDSDPLPFFDDCYEIPKVKKIVVDKCQEKLSTANRNHKISADTDFENTEEQETMLKGEIYSQKMQTGNNFPSENSPLKWQNPIISSDEEIFENSSPASSLKEENESDMAGSSEENIDSSQENNKINVVYNNSKLPNSSPNQYVMSSPSQSLISDKIFQTVNNAHYGKNVTHIESQFTYPAKKCLEFEKEGSIKENIQIDMLTDGRQKKAFCSGSMPSNKIDGSYKNFESIDSKNLNPIPSTSFYQGGCSFLTENKPIEQDKNVKHYNSVCPEMTENNVVLNKTACLKKDKNIKEVLFQEGPLSDKISENKNSSLDMNKDFVSTEKHCSRSFQFIKKIIDSSDSEDEHSFKYVIKLPSKDASISRTSCDSHTNISKLNLNNSAKCHEINNCKNISNNCTEINASEEKCTFQIHHEERFRIKSPIINLDETKAKNSNLYTKNVRSANDCEMHDCPKVSNCFNFKTSAMKEKRVGWSLELQRLFELDEIAFSCSGGDLDSSKSLEKENNLVKPISNSFSSVPSGIGSRKEILLKNSEKPSEDQSSVTDCRFKNNLTLNTPEIASKDLDSNTKLNSDKLVRNESNLRMHASENDISPSLICSSHDIAAEKYLQNTLEHQTIFPDATHTSVKFSCLSPFSEELRAVISKQNSNISYENQNSSQESSLKANNFNVVPNLIDTVVTKQNVDQLKDQNFTSPDICLNNSSKNYLPDLKNKNSYNIKDKHSNKVFANNISEEKLINMTKVEKPTVEVVDLLSDNSDDDVFIIGQTTKEKSKSISNIQILEHCSEPSTSYPNLNSSVPPYSIYTNKFENVLSKAKTKPTVKKKGFLSSIDYPCRMSKSKSECKLDCEVKAGVDKEKSILSQSHKPKEEITYESSEKFLQEILLDHFSKSKLEKKSNTPIQTNAEGKSKAWNIKSVNQTSPTCAIEKLDFSSDTEDSPSLISPLITVAKISCNDSNSCVNNCYDSKRRKVDGHILSEIKSGNCDTSNVNICDKYLMDSDSTPDLLENCSLLSNQNIAFQKHSQEIVIDDD